MGCRCWEPLIRVWTGWHVPRNNRYGMGYPYLLTIWVLEHRYLDFRLHHLPQRFSIGLGFDKFHDKFHAPQSVHARRSLKTPLT